MARVLTAAFVALACACSKSHGLVGEMDGSRHPDVPDLEGAVHLDGSFAIDGASRMDGAPDAHDGAVLYDGALVYDGAVVRDAEAGTSPPRDAGQRRDGAAAPTGPMRCADEPIPGFRQLDNGYWRPCNCFDGEPLRAVPTDLDEGIRTVPFNCEWPVGMIWSRGWVSHGPAGISRHACTYTQSGGEVAGFVAAPWYEGFATTPSQLPPGIPRDRLCVPTECLFDTPGEPAHCNDECSPVTSEYSYVTVYRVDRTACDGAASRQ